MFDISFILYRSETDVAPGSPMARQILSKAEARNAANDLTGFLHHEENFFFQWLEDPAAPLEEAAMMIQRDPRHRYMTFLWRGAADDRQFGEWRMGYSTCDDDSIMTWLAQNPVAQREKRAYASSVLAFLQRRNEAARGR